MCPETSVAWRTAVRTLAVIASWWIPIVATTIGVSPIEAEQLPLLRRPLPDTSSFGTVVGRVMAEGLPAAFANCFVIGARIGTQTAEDGSFRLLRVPVGVQKIQFASLGCERTTISLDVKPDANDSVRVDLPCPMLRCARQRSFSPDCFVANPEERARWGSGCRVHIAEVLRPDTVRISYGLMIVSGRFILAEQDSFPNAREAWDGGCSEPLNQAFTEVAYCGQCRRALDRWVQRRRRR